MQQPTDSIVLESIRDNNMIFVTVQPDNTYFHWQVEIYLYQFAKHGIADRCYALFGYTGDAPSEYATNLAKRSVCPNIKFYKDEREQKDYAPSIRPHVMAKFFKENPNLGKNVFYHDSDIFLTKLPRFDLMLQPHDNISYVSDTISYIGYEYIKECSTRYKSAHPKLPDLDIFNNMCRIVGIDKPLVISNQRNSGGAQYLLKNVDHEYWAECEKKCVELYAYLSEYEKTYPVGHHIQKWTTDMWVVFWLHLKRGHKVLVHKELDFSWATSTTKEYENLNIFHLAGITGTNCSDKFYKGKFTATSIFDAYLKNPAIFGHISKNNATYPYTEVIKEYVQNVYMPFKGITSINLPQEGSNINPNMAIAAANRKNSYARRGEGRSGARSIPNPVPRTTPITRFKISSTNLYDGVFHQDQNTKCCEKPIWRSDNGTYVVFWTGSHWVMTYTGYIDQIGPNCGGLISNSSDDPYTNNWNTSDMIINSL